MSGVAIALTSVWFAVSPVDQPNGAMGEPLLPPSQAFSAAGNEPQPANVFGQHTVFVNFDGAVLNDEREDSRTNSTRIGFTGDFEPYGQGAKRTAVLQAVQADFVAFNVLVTDERPEDGEYVMAMVGPTNFRGSLGVALLDCDNQWTQNNVVYAFHDIDDQYTASGTATTISHEVAHSYGLEHANDPADIMNAVNVGGDANFTQQCVPLVESSFGIACTDQHERHCGNAENQNSHAELLELIGTSEPDTEPPTVQISEPADLSLFTEGDSFRIEVDVQDNRGIARLTLYSDDLVVGTDDADPWGWDVTEVLPGEYDFVAEALDAGGNTTRSEPIRVVVEPVPVAAGDTEGDTDDDGSASSAGDGGSGLDPAETDGEPSDAIDPGADADENPRFLVVDAGGCACTSGPDRHNTPLAWAVLFLVAAVRPRSRRSR